MVKLGLILDVVVVRIEAQDEMFEDPCKLEVDVEFRKVTLKITSSRINVVGFRSGRSHEFECDPRALKRDLKEKPLEMTVKYDNRIVGFAQMEWPDQVLCQINDSMGELTHVAECPMFCGMPDVDFQPVEDHKTGCIEILLRLKAKCQEFCGNEYKSFVDIRRNLSKVINPNDLLFVVGQENKDDRCLALLNEMGGDSGHRTALDLSPYRMMHGKKVPKADILNTCTTAGCPELKRMASEYQHLIDQLTNCTNNSSKKRQQLPCSAQEGFDGSDESSEVKLLPNICHAAEHHPNDGIFAGEKLRTICPVEPAPILKATETQTPRCCPVCKTSVKWLPKMACCPRCGYKPVPDFAEKPCDVKITASQIMDEYAEKQNSDWACGDQLNMNSCDEKCAEQPKCRCTCVRGKICAHCRIRKECEDIYKSVKPVEKPPDDCGKCEPQGQNYNLCKSSSTDCRPYLARVFSEMRDLYNIKEPKPRIFKVNKRCENQLQGRVSKRRSRAGCDISFIDQAHDDKNQLPTAVPQSCLNDEGKQTNPAHSNKSLKPSPDTTKSQLKKPEEKGGGNWLCQPKSQYTQKRNLKIRSPLGCQTVPRNMGWLWNLHPPGAHKNWRPGFINKPVRDIMTYFLKDYPAATQALACSPHSHDGQKTEEEKEKEEHPTLHICKKNGAIYITLRPLNDTEALQHCASSSMNPITFKITKNPLLVDIRNIKRAMKEMGFSKCKCGQPIKKCSCRSFLEKKRLQYQVYKECKKRSIPSCNDRLVLDTSSDSDLEYDFGVTPPAGAINPVRRKKPKVVNNGTQYKQGDWNIPPMTSKPVNRFMKLYNCATGDRYGFAPGGRFADKAGMLLTAAQAAKEKAKKDAAADKAAAEDAPAKGKGKK